MYFSPQALLCSLDFTSYLTLPMNPYETHLMKFTNKIFYPLSFPIIFYHSVFVIEHGGGSEFSRSIWLDLELPRKHDSGCVYEAESRKKCKQGGRIHLEYGQYHPWGQPLAEKKKVSRAPAFISLWFLTADLTAPLPTVHSTSGPGRLYPSLNCKSKQTPSSLRCFLSGRGNEKGNSLTGTPALICYGLHFKPRRAHGPQKQDST